MATAAATVAIKKPTSNPFHGSSFQGCMCSWKKPDTWPAAEDLDTTLPWCEHLRQKILAQNADTDHVRNGNPHSVRGKEDIQKCSDKVVALRMAFQQHLPGFEFQSDRPNFTTVRHNFPQALLECRKLWNMKTSSTFLTKKEAEVVAQKDLFGSGRFKENCDKISKLLAKAGRSLSNPEDKDKFIQAPVATKIEVEDFVKTFLTASASARLQRRKEQLMQVKETSTTEPVEKPRVLFLTPNALLSKNLASVSSIRQTPTLPYQPEDRGVPASPMAKSSLPLPDSPDVGLSIDFCRDKLKRKFELCGNDHKSRKSLRANQNFAICMHVLATFHRSFDPIELIDGKHSFHPCHGQHPVNEKLWKDEECETYCVKPRRSGKLGYCAPCEKSRKYFLQKTKRKEKRLLSNDDQLLEGLERPGPSRRPYSTMSPETAKNQMRANAIEKRNMNEQISYLKKKLKTDSKILKVPASDSTIRELAVNVSGIILEEKWNAKEAIIDALLEVEGNGELGESNDNERKEFAEHILGEIKNMSNCMSGKKSQQRYSPKLIRMAMALWLRDNKAYEEFQEADYYMLPTIPHLKDIKSAFQSRDGEDPKIHCRFKDERLCGCAAYPKMVF
jgi:hypothetical protein